MRSFPLKFTKAQQNRALSANNLSSSRSYISCLIPRGKYTFYYSLENISLKSGIEMVYFPFINKTFHNFQFLNSPGQSVVSLEDTLRAETEIDCGKVGVRECQRNRKYGFNPQEIEVLA